MKKADTPFSELLKELLPVAAGLGLITGLVEGAGLYLLRRAEWLNWRLSNRAFWVESMWVAPFVDLALFLLAGFFLSLIGLLFPKVATKSIAWFSLIFLMLFDWVFIALFGRISFIALLLLAVGVSVQLVYSAMRSDAKWTSFVRRYVPWLAGIAVVLAEDLGAAEVVATEVDRIQHQKNLEITDLPAVTFRYGAAEAIADPDQCYDLVVLFKSWHHVPIAHMAQALGEIRRVLRPGGLAYFSEPVYWGPFNDILRLINVECLVRAAAFAALEAAVASGAWELVAERFLPGPRSLWKLGGLRGALPAHHPYPPRHRPGAYEEIRAAFLTHLGRDGAHFLKPHRVDLLRKPAMP